MNMSNTIFLQNFDRPIGSKAINKFLEGMVSENRFSVFIAERKAKSP